MYIAAGFLFGGLLAVLATQKIEESNDPSLAFDIRLLGASVLPSYSPMIDGAWCNPNSEVRTHHAGMAAGETS